MNVLANADLLSVGMAVAGTFVLGFTVLFSNVKSSTARVFFLFTTITGLWGILNYISYRLADFNATLWSLRSVLFFAVWQAFTFFLLFFVFPENEAHLPRPVRRLLAPFVALVSLLTLTPYVFSGISSSVVINGARVPSPTVAPGIAVFGVTSIALVMAGFYTVIRRTRDSSPESRSKYTLIFAGSLITFSLIITFNFLFPALFDRVEFIPFGALFTFPFVACTAYAILQRGLFNVKVAATSLLVFVLAIVSFAEVVFAATFQLILFRASIFVLILVVGISLIRGVVREVRQRELIQAQEEELELANRQQESLLHFISHEVKGYLTKNEAAFAAIAAGDFGPTTPMLAQMSQTALVDTRKGVETVIDILDASNLKSGTVSYAKQLFDLASAVADVVHDLESTAKEKGIALSYTKPVTGAYVIEGDESKIRHHVLRNVIDNSIKYTPHGSVTVELSRNPERTRLTVTDTGVGITPEDKARLFTEGGHGKDSIKVNVHSTGYGLYIAKQVVSAHGGTIRAESDGAGKGSRFVIEFPTPQEAQENGSA